MIKQSFPWAIALVTTSLSLGCANSLETTTADGGDDTTSAAGGNNGGTGGDGGDGGMDLGPCGEDCSLIDTQDCFEAVCNTGQLEGTIGECVVVPSASGTECDDGMFCTVGDTCNEGVCEGGAPNTCGMTPEQCNEITCDEGSQMCSAAAAPDGDICLTDSLCEVNGVCTGGLCVGEPRDCFFAPAGDCEVSECNEANGECEPVANAGADGMACGDAADLCAVGTTCSAGVCGGGGPRDCSALTVGCVNGVCDAATGMCIGEDIPVGGQCFDGINNCQTGMCDATLNCIASPLPGGTMCNDFSTCTDNDVCDGAGTCAGTLDPMCALYFEEAFETCPPANWTLTGEWECGVPTNVGPATAQQGTGLLATDLDDEYEDDEEYDLMYAQTPPIGLGTATDPVLTYWHWYDTESIDGYNVKVSTDGGTTFTVVDTITPAYTGSGGGQDAFTGHGQGFWEPVEVDLSAYNGMQIILRFSFRSDGSITYPGIYLDDMQVVEAADIPVSIVNPSLPNGLQDASYEVQMNADGGTGTGNWSIVAGGTNDSWLSIDAAGLLTGTPLAANVGPVSVTIRYEEAANAMNFEEVTFAFDVQTIVYTDDLEATCAMWTLGGEWECGTPTSGPNAAFSGTQLLATNLAGDYVNNLPYTTNSATSSAISLVGTTAPTMRFRVWYQTEGVTYDGFNVKVSTDGGATFAVVNDVIPAYPLTVNSEPAWGGDFGMWDEYVVDLTAFAGMSVNIRFSMRSDVSNVDPGVYVDDLTIAD